MPSKNPLYLRCRLPARRLTRALLMGVAAWVVGQHPLRAVKSTDQPGMGVPEWGKVQSMFAGLEKLGLPDVRGAQLVSDRRRITPGWSGGAGEEGLGLAWLLPPEEGVEARVIRNQVETIEVRLWGRLGMMWHRFGLPDPEQASSVRPLTHFDGEFCNGAQAVEIVREKIRLRPVGATGIDPSKVTRIEVEVFLLAANLYRSGREQQARQVLLLLGTAGGRIQRLADEAGAMVMNARATVLIRQHLQEPNWPKLTTTLHQLLAVAPAAFSDRGQLERLANRSETRGYEPFGSADRYARLSEQERTLVTRLASEVPARQFFNNALWIACEWGGVDTPQPWPEGALGEIVRQGPASLPLLAACLGDQRPIFCTHDMMGPGQVADTTAAPMLATMDELVRALLSGQIPRGEMPETTDDTEATTALRHWCLRAAKQSRLALAKRFLEAGDEDRCREVAEWLALREDSGQGLEVFREWLPRQPDEWMRMQGFLLLYDALGRHGSKLKDLLGKVRPRLLAMDEPVDAAQRAIGHSWELRRELAVLDHMAAASSPLEGIVAVIAEGGISTSRCRERLPRVFLHTPPEQNIATVLAALPRFRWGCEAERVLASLRSSGGNVGSTFGGIQNRRPPVPYEGLRDAWTTALSDERELFTCLPQFSATVGEAAAWACLAIHGAEDRPRYGEFPVISERSDRFADVSSARALLRGEIKVRGPESPTAGSTLASQPKVIPPTFVVGRFLGVSASGRTAYLNDLPAAERAALRTFLVAPNTLAGATELPPSVRAEMCESARTIHILEPTASDHPLRQLEGQRLSDETMSELLRSMADGLSKGQNEVTTLRLSDTLDGVSMVSRPLDLAAMAMEIVSNGNGASSWITQWLQYGPLGPESESMPIEQRRLLVVSLVSRSDSYLTYPVSLTKRLLDKYLLPPGLAESAPSEAAWAEDSNHVRGDVDDATQAKAGLLLWRNLRALLHPDLPAVVEPGGPPPPPFIPCEGLVLWSFDPVAMRSALVKP